MADTKIEQQNVTIEFKVDDYIPAKYVFEMDDRPDEDQTLYGAVRIRRYPALPPGTWNPIGTPMYFDQGINCIVTEGTLLATREYREKEVSGSSIITGDSEYPLTYPVVSGLTYSIDGQAYDKRGNTIQVNIGFDSVRNALVFSRECYAVVKFFYMTQYVIIRYYPSIFSDYETYYMPDPEDYGQLLGFIKTPAVIGPIDPVIFAINPPEGIAAEFELYRVESKGIATTDGMWEAPMGWPTEGTFPNSDETLDSNDSNIEVSRTHEIGYFSLLNSTSRQSSYRSATSEILPLNYAKEMLFASSAGQKVGQTSMTMTSDSSGASVTNSIVREKRVQNREHFDKYKRMMNRAPKMRTVHYDIPVGKPYKDISDINQFRDVVRTVTKYNAVDAMGGTQDRQQVTDTLLTFRIKLTIKAPSRPSVSGAVIRNQSNEGNVDFNMQAQRINSMLSLIWEGVDWAHLRKRIIASYDPVMYELTFDSSFPNV